MINTKKLLLKIVQSLLTETETSTRYGLTVTLYRTGKMVDLYVAGTTTSELSTSGTYVVIGSTSTDSFKPLQDCVTRTFINSSTFGQLRINTDGGVRLGYTCDNSGTAKTIPSGTEVYLHVTYMAA